MRTETRTTAQQILPRENTLAERYRCENTRQKITWTVASAFFLIGIIVLCCSGGSTEWNEGRLEIQYEYPIRAYIGWSFFGAGPLMIALLFCCTPRREREEEPLVANQA